jgi:hypothetical protein
VVYVAGGEVAALADGDGVDHSVGVQRHAVVGHTVGVPVGVSWDKYKHDI